MIRANVSNIKVVNKYVPILGSTYILAIHAKVPITSSSPFPIPIALHFKEIGT